MEFFDKKEEVIDIQLTQYGKLLLSKGILKPVYYAFFDDGIIYDVGTGGSTEEINSIEDRIKEFPYCKTQYAFHGVETNFKAENKRLASSNVRDRERVEYLPSPYERYNALQYTLSNSNPGDDTVPLMNVNALLGKFENTSLSYHTGSMSALPVPQLSASIEYKVVPSPAPTNFEPDRGEYMTEILVNQDLLDSKIKFFDGASVSVEGSGLLVEFIESNSAYKEENFELEIYEVIPAVDTNNDGTKDKPEELLPMYFSDPENRSEYLIDNFFNVLADEQINEDLLRLATKVKRGTFLGTPKSPRAASGTRNQDIYRIPDGLSGRNQFDSEIEDCDIDSPGDDQ